MASTSQKKTTKKTSGKSGSRTTAKKPQPRPIRREVGGVVCLVLALCVFVSYFGISAIFIDWLAVLIKGLLGYGYWLFGPALVLAGCILLFHHGRPVTLRVTSALLLPVLLGTLCHMLLVKEAYASSIGIIPAMWKDGVALKCGGVISGALGQGSVAVFSLAFLMTKSGAVVPTGNNPLVYLASRSSVPCACAPSNPTARSINDNMVLFIFL